MCKSLGNGLTLHVGACGEYIDDGLLVSTEALHSSPQSGRVLRRVEVLDAENGGLTLMESTYLLRVLIILNICSIYYF